MDRFHNCTSSEYSFTLAVDLNIVKKNLSHYEYYACLHFNSFMVLCSYHAILAQVIVFNILSFTSYLYNLFTQGRLLICIQY